MYGMPPRMLKAGPEPGPGLLSSVQHVPGDSMSPEAASVVRRPLLSPEQRYLLSDPLFPH